MYARFPSLTEISIPTWIFEEVIAPNRYYRSELQKDYVLVRFPRADITHGSEAEMVTVHVYHDQYGQISRSVCIPSLPKIPA